MHFGEISDYSDLTAGQYEGLVLKRERHYKWTPYWCVLYGRQLTFYDSHEKRHVVGRIELQPGSRCDKERQARVLPSLDELFHKEYNSMKKYQLRLKTKKATHVFTYEDVKEQSRWQMAINNASQVNASGVRLSWIPTPFSMVTTPTEEKHIHFPVSSRKGQKNSDSSDGSQRCGNNLLAKPSKSKTRRDDTKTLIQESDSEMMTDDGFGVINPNLDVTPKEMITSL